MSSEYGQRGRNAAWFKQVATSASHRLLRLVCTGLCLGLPLQSLGQGVPLAPPAAGAVAPSGAAASSASTATLSVVSSSPEATLLRQIQKAARHLNYEGVFTFQQGESIESSRMIHVFDGKDEKERIEVLDGPPREYLRHNDEVQSLIPEQKIILREQQRGDRFPGLLVTDPAALEAHYQLRILPRIYCSRHKRLRAKVLCSSRLPLRR